MNTEGVPKSLRSAFDSPTFGEDVSFRLDKPVGSASISPCGRDIVLASRMGLHIIDLDSPYSPPRYLPHHTPWEVADVQWSPFAARDSWVVSTSNQKALLWNLEMRNPRSSIEHVLHAHTRAITDINFSAHHPDILATCAVDSFVHCWDIRYPMRPAISFCDWFAGATQVKWNRQDSHVLASSHDKMLRIWDDRKGAYPLRSIEAHATKIYGVDWNRAEPRGLVTCSLDRTIKFWDYASTSDKPQGTINTRFPVWRARHTPFGDGLLAMPQRGNHDLHLYDRRSLESNSESHMIQPVHSFDGHNDQVKEFLWRPRGTITDGIDSREFQLVSWGSDKMLRLHRVNEAILATVGFAKGHKPKSHTNLTRRNANYKTFREGPPSALFEDASFPEGDFLSQSGKKPGVRGDFDIGMSNGPVIERGFRQAWTPRSMAVSRNKNLVDMDPISWMKGVKIGKRDSSPSGVHQSLSSLLLPNSTSDRTWERFESLGEEITHVGQKFGKVTFDEIDMLNRIASFSLLGPWGSAGASSWIKCRIHFPDDYPDVAEPTFTVQESPSTTKEQVQHITDEVQSILTAYLGEQWSSLEAVVLYLLGERDLEQSLLWLRTRMDFEPDVPQNSAESSSDDEDCAGLDTSDVLIVPNTQYNVPLGKACGVLWANDGRLVCFFPKRQGKQSSLVNNLSLKVGSQKGMFEGFGRFNHGLPVAKRPLTMTTSESEHSEYEVSSSSSGSSTSSEGILAPDMLFMPAMAWHGGSSEGPPDQSVDETQRSLGAFRDASLNNNYVSIHNCDDLLPSKKAFAQEYVLYADPQKCCAHNSSVAAANGAQEKADIWSLLELIIKREVPLEIVQHPRRNETILAAARRATSSLRTVDSAIDLSYDLTHDLQRSESVKWGHHPFGSKWLVDSIFLHFESLADTQMLAMLSCVLSEPSRDFNAPSGTGQPLWEGTTGHDFAFTKYFPSIDIAHEIFNPQSAHLEYSTRNHKNQLERQSASSSITIPKLDHLLPITHMATHYKRSRANLERQDSQSTSMSTSPEQLRYVPRSNTNLASAFAASLSLPFSLNSSAPSSPPSQPRNRLSPAGSYLGAPPGVNWSPSSFLGQPPTLHEEKRPPYSLSVSDIDEETPTPKPLFKTKLKNQQHFHNDGYADAALLDPEKGSLYRAYREAYANMLFLWDMPITMCEVLKFNKEDLLNTENRQTPLAGLAMGKAVTESAASQAKQAINFRDACSACNTALASGVNGMLCRICSTPSMPLVCLLCDAIIRGLASPCLACGHVLHTSCRALLCARRLSGESYTGDEDDEEEEEEEEEELLCVSGCGCHCSYHTTVEIAEQQYDVWNINIGTDDIVAEGKEAARWQGQSEGHAEHFWQDVAYESLARNLGSRTVTPKSSQIWRGGEDDLRRNRKKSVGSSLKNEECFS